MCLEDIILVPLHAQDGSVRAYSLIDRADAPIAEAYRWWLGGDDYAISLISGETIYLHREIMGLTYGDPLVVDHKNRQRLDNRRSNLRVVTKAVNAKNRSKRVGSSLHKGVYWKKPDPLHRTRGKWYARIIIDRKMIHLGGFETEDEAAAAVEAGRRQHAVS
jgi:hypothetical protein